MITDQNENYIRFILLLIRGGTKLLRTIVKNGLERGKINLDNFLTLKRDAIYKSKHITRLQREMLFPASSKVTDIEEWDITLLAFIASEFLLSDLTSVEKQAVIKIRDMRNNYQAHNCDASIDKQTFTIIWTELTLVITTVCNTLPEYDKSEFNGLITSTSAVDFNTAVTEIKQLDRANEYFRNIQRSIEEMQQSQEHILAVVSSCHQEVIRLKKDLSFLKTNIESNGKSTRIVNTVFGVLTLCAEEEHIVDTAETILLNKAKPDTKDGEKTALDRLFDKFKDDIVNLGVTQECVEKGSVVFRFTCPSIASLIDLIGYFNDDLIQKRLHDISEALSAEVCHKVMLKAHIKTESLEKAIEKLRLLDVQEPDLGQRSKKRKISGKVFNDPIHGQIELDILCVKIIDTPQFQRMRYIKQLESCYMVYPGASHNRFEHSIGVCYLAGKLLRALKGRQPDENITTKDILCVQVAALCHDLGQGPFSHVFEEQFIPSINPDQKWRHEHASVMMFEYLLKANNERIKQYFEQLMPDFEDKDICFIKELIDVPKDLDSSVWPYKGRGKEKSFLYEIVANKKSGVDIDKWDYLARDSHMLGMKSIFDHTRCISSARILMSDGRKQICYRDKTAQDLYDMFYTRMTLHRRAYQHKTKNIIGIMICDALIAANDDIFFVGENGQRLRMSDTINDMAAYTQLTDDVFHMILRSSDLRLKKSRDILNSIQNRDLYTCIAQTQIKGGEVEKMAFRENLFNKIQQRQDDMTHLAESFVEIDVVNLDYGMKDKDPVQNVRFYCKQDENQAVEIDKNQVSFVLPDTFSEQYVRVYCKVMDSQLTEIIQESFKEWCVENSHPQPKGSLFPRGSLLQ